MGDEPLRHLRRVAPPWVPAAEELTECGRPVKDVAAAVTWDEAAAYSRKNGRQRTAMTHCMTCIAGGTVRRQAWETNATEITLRWLQRGYIYGRSNETTDRYLHALAALVAAHPDEFEAQANPPEGVTDLAARRGARKAAPR